ncbi:ABC transporter substrate-binding protein [Brevibacillus migulae]|uniref:ABC transporter substrate-binding protein n=1 Tax=Brevibacillus migulae TaxID=1644114 RepID=UPI00106EB5A6|nr:ABC transporter substrate-binding protein [Brevibacillus migulae]
MTRHVLSTRALVIFGMLAVWLVGCSAAEPGPRMAEKQAVEPPPQPAAPRDQELVIAGLEKLPAFDPFGISKKKAQLHDLERITYQGLFTYGDDLNLVPALASGYTIDRSQSKPAIVVTLRKEARWSDGKPVTVDDVVFTYEQYARPHYYGVWREWAHLLEGVSPFRTGKAAAISGMAVDRSKGTIRFVLNRDDVSFLQSLTAPMLAKHQLQGKSIGEIDALSKSGKLLGAGPFQINGFFTSEWTYAANSSYYGSKPRLERLRVIPVAAANMQEQLEAGKIHISWLSPEEASQMGRPNQGKIIPAAAHGYHFVGFNLHSPAVKDLAIRTALAKAIPIDSIAKNSFYGWADSVQSPLAPGSFAYTPAKWPSYQPEEAAQALAQKGFTKEKPLELTFVYPAGNPVRERLANELVKAWESLPIRLEKKALPADGFVAYLFGGSKVDLYLYAWEYPTDPAELTRMWHSREKVGEKGLNASRYENAQADQWLEKGARLLPQPERQKIYEAWQKHFAQDLPIFPLIQVRNPYYVSNHVQGIPDRLGLHPYERIAEWRIE